MRVEINEINKDKKLKYVIIQSRYKDKWVFVRHKDRTTWELPGGHIEKGEHPDQAARRELEEETGAVKFDLRPICNYFVADNDGSSASGRVYFANIKELGDLEYEIEEIRLFDGIPKDLTYEEIIPHIFNKVKSTIE